MVSVQAPSVNDSTLSLSLIVLSSLDTSVLVFCFISQNNIEMVDGGSHLVGRFTGFWPMFVSMYLHARLTPSSPRSLVQSVGNHDNTKYCHVTWYSTIGVPKCVILVLHLALDDPPEARVPLIPDRCPKLHLVNHLSIMIMTRQSKLKS